MQAEEQWKPNSLDIVEDFKFKANHYSPNNL